MIRLMKPPSLRLARQTSGSARHFPTSLSRLRLSAAYLSRCHGAEICVLPLVTALSSRHTNVEKSGSETEGRRRRDTVLECRTGDALNTDHSQAGGSDGSTLLRCDHEINHTSLNLTC